MNRLDPLTGLRGVAAYSVLLAHGGDTFFPDAHSYNSRLAYFGMSLFFLLSGFVIYYNYAELFRKEPLIAAVRVFFAARFARLYPLYALSIAIAVICNPAPHFIYNPPVILSFVTLTQSWFNTEMATFPPDWSISTEWFFYLAFIPLSYALVGVRRPVLALAVWCALSFAGLTALFHFMMQPMIAFVESWLSQPPPISAGAVGWITYFCPFVRVLEFVAGALAAKAYLKIGARSKMTVPVRIAFGLSIAWCAAVMLVPYLAENPYFGLLASNFLFAPGVAPLMLLCCVYDTPLSRALSSRPMLFAGDISYSVYIWSFSALTLISLGATPVAGSLASLGNSALRLASAIFLTTIVAYGSYHLVEMPSRRSIRAILIGRSSKGQPASRSPTGREVAHIKVLSVSDGRMSEPAA
jgi:peptidoglycan/LPS O-acetylase OafA/YrhL